MASTPSSSLKLNKQGTGDNNNTWGTVVNEQVIDLIDEAIAQQVTISLTGNHTLSSTNYASNESRQSYLIFTDGGLGSVPTVTAPGIEKWWFVKNAGSTYAITFGVSGGTSVSIPAGKMVVVFSNGTDCEKLDLANLGGLVPLASVDGGTDISTVAGIAADVTAVAAIDTDVTTVAAIDSNVTTVAGVAANVTTVAGISANVTTVAGISANVTTVAGDSADIGTVATNISSVNTCATNIADIQTASNLISTLDVNVVGNAGASASFSVADGNYHTVTLDQNSTFDLQAGSLTSFILYLEITNGGAYTITWSDTINWHNNTVPTLLASGKNLLAFITTDGGTSFKGIPVWDES